MPEPEQVADEIRGSIAESVGRLGPALKRLTPHALVATLSAAALAPIALPLIAGAVPFAAAAALLGATGQNFLASVVHEFASRRRGRGEPASGSELRDHLELELRKRVETDAELRHELSVLLRSVGGVEVALAAASGEVKEALAAGLTEIGSTLDEFQWMLRDVQVSLGEITAMQRKQLQLMREQLTKTNVLIRLHEPPALAPEAGPRAERHPPAPGAPPYKGLESFQPEDARFFFGRERFVAEMTARLQETPLLVVAGPSGSGKSSLIQAGLIPAIWEDALPGSREWRVIALTPTDRPLFELAASIAVESGVAAGAVLEDLQVSPSRIELALRQVLAGTLPATRVVLVVDQLEEVFTLCRSEEERSAFLEAIVHASAAPRTLVVLGVRADFYARCLEYPALAAALEDRQLVVSRLTEAELRAAIERPAQAGGLELEPGLVERIVHDLGSEPGSLPLLSHALLETWKQRSGRTLTREGYEAAGGVREAITRTAEHVFESLSPAEQRVARAVFLRLTELGEGTEDTRRRVRREELGTGSDAGLVDGVLAELTEARLVTASAERVEVAHEALIREWPRLRAWLDEDREGLRLHRHLTEAASDWEALDRDPGTLYRGGRLAAASEWAESHAGDLNPIEREFLDAGRAAAASELEAARRRNRRLRLLAASLAALAVAAAALGVLALAQKRSADRTTRTARAQTLAARGTADFDTQLDLGLLLALESYRVKATAAGRSAIMTGLVRSAPISVLLRQPAGATSIAVSPDGQRLAVGLSDGGVQLWRTATREREGPALRWHRSPVTTVVFSRDGRTLATSGDHQTVVWDVATHERTGSSFPGAAAAFSPDGRKLALLAWIDRVSVWDIRSHRRLARVRTEVGANDLAFTADGKTVVIALTQGIELWHLGVGGATSREQFPVGWVESLAPSRNGRWLVLGGQDGLVELWDVRAHRVRRSFEGLLDTVYDVAVSDDGTRLAAGGFDSLVLVWNASTGKRIGNPLRGHAGAVNGVAFAGSNGRVISAGDDGAVIVWDLGAGGGLRSDLTTGHDDVQALAFSPDGRTLASGSFEHHLLLWDVRTKHASSLPARDAITDLAFSPDGRVLAVGTDDGTVAFWATRTRRRLGGARAYPAAANADVDIKLVFSSDGRLVVSAASVTTSPNTPLGFLHPITRPRPFVFWDLSSGRPVARRPTTVGIVNRLAFVPGGSTFVAASETDDGVGHLSLWDARERKSIRARSTGDQGVTSVSVSAGGLIAVGRPDGTVLLVRGPDLEAAGVLHAQKGAVSAVAFGAGEQLVTAGNYDNKIHLWNAQTRETMGEPLELAGGVETATLSRDGSELAAWGLDSSGVALWKPVLASDDVGGAAVRLCSVVHRNLTKAQWERNLGWAGYEKTCPMWPPGR